MGNAYGRWSIIRRLDGGGNAEVYVATDGAAEVALKVLHQRKQSPDTEAYRRFRDEVSIQRRLTPRRGILPLLDADLPETASRDNPAWLVTPLATPIERALGDRPELRPVVEATAELAEVLAALAEEGISHRDIKPNNLYEYQGNYVLGDFGLVSYPGKDVLTDGARAVGPIYFQAPEMIFTPETADGRPADVYSLAKTLWVLACSQRWPLPGEHRLDVPSMLLQQLIGGPRAEYLDHLIARSTRFDPASRPSMREVAQELRAWLAPSVVPAQAADISEAAKRLDVLLAAGRQEQLDRQRYQAQLRFALEDLQRLLAPMRDNLVNQGLTEAKLTSSNPTALEGAPLEGVQEGRMIGSDGVSLIVQMPGGADPILWSGVGLRLFDDGNLQIVAGHRIRRPGHDRSEPLWSQEAFAHVGSARAQSETARLIEELAHEMSAAVERYVAAVQEARVAPLPLPKSDLSPNGQRLAVYLSVQSTDALTTHFAIADLVERLAIVERDLVDAAMELQGKGWVGLGKDANSKYGVHGIVTKALLFLKTEAELRGGNPKSDAVRFVAEPVDGGSESLQVDERAKALGWSARRVNIGCYFLVAYSGVDRALDSSAEPYAYASLWLGPKCRDFVRRNR